jgi:uncharacterized protein (UPF0218 family)
MTELSMAVGAARSGDVEVTVADVAFRPPAAVTVGDLVSHN